MASVARGEISRPHPVADTLLAATGMLLMIAQVPFFLSIGILAPLTGRVVLIAAWLLLATLGLHWFRDHPARVLGLAMVMGVFWYTAGVLAEGWLDWTV
ncbi:hypothetical protein [Ruania alba]|uniref:Uncharacterized protein n=1 Tax=Ruania alba TaxID=648782 RepID=A0A1H5D1M8_9MICO|nr:hypothetical protein [Ruania alba]SED72837.1 hypothetical protein SAMN04488554_0542 [Ruania alba]